MGNIRQWLQDAIAHGQGRADTGTDSHRPQWTKNGIGAVALAGVVAFGVLAILWEIVKQPLALIYGLVGLGVGYALVRAVWMAAA